MDLVWKFEMCKAPLGLDNYSLRASGSLSTCVYGNMYVVYSSCYLRHVVVCAHQSSTLSIGPELHVITYLRGSYVHPVIVAKYSDYQHITQVIRLVFNQTISLLYARCFGNNGTWYNVNYKHKNENTGLKWLFEKRQSSVKLVHGFRKSCLTKNSIAVFFLSHILRFRFELNRTTFGVNRVKNPSVFFYTHRTKTRF